MKIAIIQGSTQVDKNETLYKLVKKVTKDQGHEVYNFGVFKDETETYSYTEIALLVSLLLSSGVVDFVVTGCSSGQGMNMACNSLPNVLCGFVQNPQDAFLFGRINDGNAVSLSLGLGYGWLGELNLEYTLEKLFDGEFGIGYPAEVAERKVRETKIVKTYNHLGKRTFLELIEKLDDSIIEKVFKKTDVIDFIVENTKNNEIRQYVMEVSGNGE